MQIIRDKYREPTSKRMFRPTDKEPGWTFEQAGDIPWMLAGRIEEVLGPEGGTIGEIYHKVTGPMGLSLDNTRDLVRKALKEGYLT